MQIPVLVECVGKEKYRAEPLRLSAEGSTPDEALRRLRELIESKIAGGAKIMSIEVPGGENPLMRLAGTLDPNDPMVQEWEEIMKENRRKADWDPDYL